MAKRKGFVDRSTNRKRKGFGLLKKSKASSMTPTSRSHSNVSTETRETADRRTAPCQVKTINGCVINVVGGDVSLLEEMLESGDLHISRVEGLPEGKILAEQLKDFNGAGAWMEEVGFEGERAKQSRRVTTSFDDCEEAAKENLPWTKAVCDQMAEWIDNTCCHLHSKPPVEGDEAERDLSMHRHCDQFAGAVTQRHVLTMNQSSKKMSICDTKPIRREVTFEAPHGMLVSMNQHSSGSDRKGKMHAIKGARDSLGMVVNTTAPKHLEEATHKAIVEALMGAATPQLVLANSNQLKQPGSNTS
jgi:hypothetical protein